ncbi:MAG: ABC transporter substrate-binding protein [Chloroflexi bacterium]|nr:ABC transporter substrate-binding protein [Chloroflexota bacterium]
MWPTRPRLPSGGRFCFVMGPRMNVSVRPWLRLPVALVALLGILMLLRACSPGDSAKQSGAQATVRSGAPAATLAGAATATAAPTAATFPFTLTGTDGVGVKLTRQPERIVSLSPGSTETLFAIGAGGLVIAADRFSDFPEAAKALPKVEYSRPSIESLVAHRPDLVIATGRQRDTIAAMRAADLSVVLFEEPVTVAAVIEKVQLYGRFTGRTGEAEKLAAEMKARVNAVTAKIDGVTQGPRVFHELSNQLSSAAPSSFVGDLYTLLRARNIAEGATTAFPQLSQESIVQRDPEVIILADGREGVTPEQVRGRPGWSGIAAVRSGRIVVLTDTQADVSSRPGPRVVDALETLAKLLYPDRF